MSSLSEPAGVSTRRCGTCDDGGMVCCRESRPLLEYYHYIVFLDEASLYTVTSNIQNLSNLLAEVVGRFISSLGGFPFVGGELVAGGYGYGSGLEGSLVSEAWVIRWLCFCIVTVWTNLENISIPRQSLCLCARWAGGDADDVCCWGGK